MTRKKHPQTKSFDAYIEKRFGKETLLEWQTQALNRKNNPMAKKYAQSVSLDDFFEEKLGKDLYIKSKQEGHRRAEILLAMHELMQSSSVKNKNPKKS